MTPKPKSNIDLFREYFLLNMFTGPFMSKAINSYCGYWNAHPEELLESMKGRNLFNAKVWRDNLEDWVKRINTMTPDLHMMRDRKVKSIFLMRIVYFADYTALGQFVINWAMRVYCDGLIEEGEPKDHGSEKFIDYHCAQLWIAYSTLFHKSNP